MEEGVSVTKNEEVEHCQDKSEGSEGDEDAKNHLSGWPLSFLVMALMLSSFMLALDNTILGTLSCVLFPSLMSPIDVIPS